MRVVHPAAMFACRHRAPALAAVLTVSACLPDEEPLFDQVAPVNVSSSEPAAMAAPTPPAGAVVSAPEQRSAPGAPSVAPTASATGAGFAGTPEPEPAPAAPEQGLCDRQGLLACETFEDQLLAQFPAGGAWLPELPGCGTHQVDGSGPAISGVNALRAADGGYPECMLHADIGGEGELHVRTSVFLGPGAELVGQYFSLIELGVSATRDDPELRVGLRPGSGGPCDGVPGIDLTGNGLVGGTVTECSGVPLEQERWHCLEVHVSRAGQSTSVSVSVDGSAVLARDVEVGEAWAEPGRVVKLGRAAYGASGQGSLWHDDIVVSREPVPCEP